MLTTDSYDMAKTAIDKCVLNTRHTYDYYQTSTEWLAFSNWMPKLSQQISSHTSASNRIFVLVSMRSERLLCECVRVSFHLVSLRANRQRTRGAYELVIFAISSKNILRFCLRLWSHSQSLLLLLLLFFVSRIRVEHTNFEPCFAGYFNSNIHIENHACVFTTERTKSLITFGMPKTYHYNQKHLNNGWVLFFSLSLPLITQISRKNVFFFTKKLLAHLLQFKWMRKYFSIFCLLIKPQSSKYE